MLPDGEERVQFGREERHGETVRMPSSKVGQRTYRDTAGRVQLQTINQSMAAAPIGGD